MLFSLQRMTAILNLELPCKIVGRSSSGRILLRIAFATSQHNPPIPSILIHSALTSTSPVICSVDPIYIRYLSARNASERKVFSIVNGNHDNHLQSPRKNDDVSSLCSPTSEVSTSTNCFPLPHRSTEDHSQAARVYQHVILTVLWLLYESLSWVNKTKVSYPAALRWHSQE